MPLWRLYYHIVWATKNRLPLIDEDIEPVLHRFIIGKANAFHSHIHAIGGIEDHIHIIVSIPPSLSISDFVSKIKGSSSYHVNHRPSAQPVRFNWQDGYSVFSLGGKQLDDAVRYVNQQKQHHQSGTTILSLERLDGIDQPPSGGLRF